MPDIKPILIRARELIADPDHWIQGCYANGAIADPDTTCFCTVGAIDRAVLEKKGLIGPDIDDDTAIAEAEYSNEGAAAIDALQQHLETSFVADFNDNGDTTHADVLNLIDKAIADA